MYQLLKALVGSHAHGLATETSDMDYRGVFVTPTNELLKVDAKTRQTHWDEGHTDDTEWEVQHFLSLASKCNPTILETFVGTTYTANEWGEKIRALFPYVWNSLGVRNAFIGYGRAQQKKFLENKDSRPNKYATAYVRSLFNAWELLTTGTFRLNITGTEVEHTCRRFRAGNYTRGDVIDICTYWEKRVDEAYGANPDKQTNLEPVNELLLEIRKAYWQ